MKNIVLVALLAAAAGCSKKSGPDCDGAIAKGMESYSAAMKARAPNPQIAESMMGVVSKVKEALIERCKADKWPAEVVSCFGGVTTMQSMQACQSKLTEDQRNKLVGELREAMMSARAAMGGRMPGGMPGHPPMLNGSAGGAGAAPAAPEAAGSAAPAAPPAAAAGAPASPAAPAAPAAASAPAAPDKPAAGGW